MSSRENAANEAKEKEISQEAAEAKETEEVKETEEKEQEQAKDEEGPLEKLERELSEQKEKYLRLMAEYDNFRKRSAKERLDLTSSAKGDTLSEILPVFDNFERALNAETTDESYKQGVSMIFKQMGDVLNKLGVEVIDPTGQEFDPNVANAVNQIQDENYGENVVAQTFQKGYKIGGKVIRYAMVVVANP